MRKITYILLIFVVSILIGCTHNNPVESDKSYNPNNKIRKISHYDARGELELYLTFEYDAEDKKTKISQYNSSDNLCAYNTFEYVKGKVISKQFADLSLNGSFDFTGSYISELDADGNEIKMSVYDPTEKLREYYINEYDNEGKIIKESLFDASDKLLKYYTYKYNNTGKNTYTYNYNAVDELFTYSKSEYDSEGNIIKESVLYEDKVLYYLTFEY